MTSTSTTGVRRLDELLSPEELSTAAIGAGWQLRAIISDDCMAYIAWNESTREALAVDPKADDWPAIERIVNELKGYRWLGVIDTHTHADHVSAAYRLSERVRGPLLMHERALSRRVQLRVGHDVSLASAAAPLRLIPTPGHTPDGITAVWGPFLFGGDTLVVGDSGRDDLPGGDPAAHFESLELLKREIRGNPVLLPGHDCKGGRAALWSDELSRNSSLTQSREDFIRESMEFRAPPPRLLKESLFENFK